MDEHAEFHVLHIDDEPELAAVTAEYLEQHDDRFEIETATSASDGLDRLAQHEYDCVVSDYDMPSRDGIELLESARDLYPDLPFILFTGKGSEEVAGEALRKGATDYLQKRGGTEQYNLLANRIRNAVQRYETEQSRRQWKHAIETATEGIAIVSEDGQFLQMNDAYADAYGESPDALVGTNWREWYPDDEIDRFKNEILPTLREEGTWGGESIGRRTDGTEFTQHLSLSMLEGGGHVCVMRDITEQKEREEQLKETTLKLETLVEAFPDVAFIKDVEGNYLEAFASSETEPLLYEGPEAYEDGQHVTDVFDDEDADRVLATIQRAVDTGTIQSLEYELDVPSGTRWFEGRVAPIDGTIQGRQAVVWVARDITDRKEREERQELVETLFKHAQECQFIVAVEGGEFRLRHANDYYKRVVGLSPDEQVAGQTPRELFGQAAGKEVLDRYGKCRETRESITYTVELPVPDEGTVYETVLTPIVSDDSVTHIVGTARDITDRTEREQELRRLKEEYETIFQNVDDSLFLVEVAGSSEDREFRFRRINPANESVLGVSAEEVRGNTPTEVFGEEVGSELVANYERCLDRGESISYEERLDLDEGPRIFETTLTPVEIDSEPRLIVGVAHDITDRKERERELAEFEEAVDAICENVPLIFYTFDDQGEFIRSQGQALERIGFEPGEAVGQSVFDLYSDRPEIIEHCERALDGERVTATVEIADGIFKAHYVPIREDGEVVGVTGHKFDVTDYKRRQQELERQNERLDEFVSVVSHDLRNPLHVASGQVALARDECDSEYLDTAEESLARMETLITDLLTLAREGETVSDPEPVNLAALVETCWKTVTTDEATVGIDTDLTVKADRSRLRQALENLFRNAVEHGGDDVTVTVGNLPDRDGFYVADDGPGIPETERERVFDGGYSTTDDGTGFGLAIVAEIVEAHGWDISVTESIDGGARFDIVVAEGTAE